MGEKLPAGAPKELNREDAELAGRNARQRREPDEVPQRHSSPRRAELGSTVSPEAIAHFERDRVISLHRVLHAILLLDAEEDEDRKRLYIHAEPGLVASPALRR